ncbi:hypothetical protein F5Y04DRAFT_282789 [Hypomontagnella monticulosa]|nr:hypothetical protein F5Y04DRAFT_282789 [Hypomontagnella monticulosa]
MSSTISSAPTATIVNGNFDDSSTSYSPWTAASSLNAYITTSNPHSAPNALAITYTVDSARSYLSVVQTLSTTAGLTAGTYTFTGYARSDMLYIGVYGCNSFYISCPGGTFVSYNQFVSGFKLVPNVYGMMSTTCTFSDAQIAAGPMVQLNGGNCGVGNYAFDDITITPA